MGILCPVCKEKVNLETYTCSKCGQTFDMKDLLIDVSREAEPPLNYEKKS